MTGEKLMSLIRDYASACVKSDWVRVADLDRAISDGIDDLIKAAS